MYRSYDDLLRPRSEQDSPPDQKQEDAPRIPAEELAEAMKIVSEFCMVYDYDSAMSVIESLADYRMPGNIEDDMATLRNAINVGDYEKITQLTDVLKNRLERADTDG
jgi:hypothetical protein